MKRILTIQDISCIGKCSLTVALPIVSAFGVETAVIPTAVLSTHTAFKGFTFRDLTSDILPICKHWQQEKVSFDGIYTGYLGSLEQIEIVIDIINTFKKEKQFVLVDPAMADNGVLYKGFDKNFALNMAKLCAKADIIVPNITEASFMLKIDPVLEGYNEDYIKDLLKKLTNLGSKIAILTGVSFDKNLIGAYGYDSVKDEYFYYYKEKLPNSFHGTGDVFASALCGAITIKNDLSQALKIAVDFVWESIYNTIKNPNHNWYGVDFESAFPSLINMIKK